MSTHSFADYKELAQALTFNASYVRMCLRKFPEYDKNTPIDETLAQKVAEKLSRPWPPAA